MSKIAIDKSSGIDKVYALYTDNSSNYGVMEFTSGNWVSLPAPAYQADEDMQDGAIAVDSHGVPYIFVCDGQNQDMYSVLKYDGISNWQVIGSADFTDQWSTCPNIKFDNQGTLYVAYSGNGAAVVSKFDGSSWVNIGNPYFTSGGADYLSLALDKNSTPYVTYQNYDGITEGPSVMKFDGSSWNYVGPKFFSGTDANFTSIDIDKDNGNLLLVLRMARYTFLNSTVPTGVLQALCLLHLITFNT